MANVLEQKLIYAKLKAAASVRNKSVNFYVASVGMSRQSILSYFKQGKMPLEKIILMANAIGLALDFVLDFNDKKLLP